MYLQICFKWDVGLIKNAASPSGLEIALLLQVLRQYVQLAHLQGSGDMLVPMPFTVPTFMFYYVVTNKRILPPPGEDKRRMQHLIPGVYRPIRPANDNILKFSILILTI